MATSGGGYVNQAYEAFDRGDATEYGPDQGFNTWIRLDDPELFTEDAKANPVIGGLLDAPFKLYFVQFKSSTREAEYFVHTPLATLGDQVEGIAGDPDVPPDAHLMTLVMNHHRTLAYKIMRATAMVERSDNPGTEVGLTIHKEGDT